MYTHLHVLIYITSDFIIIHLASHIDLRRLYPVNHMNIDVGGHKYSFYSHRGKAVNTFTRANIIRETHSSKQVSARAGQ